MLVYTSGLAMGACWFGVNLPIIRPLWVGVTMSSCIVLALMGSAWSVGVNYFPLGKLEANDEGLTVGRFRTRRFAWSEVAGLVEVNDQIVRVLVITEGRARTYTCNAMKLGDRCRGLFARAAERVGKTTLTRPEIPDINRRREALLLATAVMIPSFLVVFAMARWWGWLSLLVVYATLFAILDATLAFRLSFWRKTDPFAAWRAAVLRHREPAYRN